MRSRSGAVLAGCVLLLVALAPGRAGATLVGQLVGVSLGDGDALALFDTVLVVEPGAEITPGDGSEIGDALLPSESIDIGEQGVVLVLEEGAADGATGYPAGTVLLLSNLVFFDVETRILGVTVSTDNVTNLTGVTFTDDSLTIPLDALVIGELPGVDVGSVTIDLEVEVVPEPAGAALAAGLALLALAKRRSLRAG